MFKDFYNFYFRRDFIFDLLGYGQREMIFEV